MQISDLDPNYHPHRVHFTHDGNDYLATFKEPGNVFLFLAIGEQIEAKGSLDCTKVPSGELEKKVFELIYRVFLKGSNLGLSDLKTGLSDKLALAQRLNQDNPTRSRELSLCITKIEESLMWLEKAITLSLLLDCS